MAKKRDTKKKDEEAPLPKFGGFHPLAAGLGGFKAKLDSEAKVDEDKRKAAAAQGKPLPPPRPAAAPAAPRRAETSTSAADDEMSFHRMMSGVVPLDAGARSRIPMTAD